MTSLNPSVSNNEVTFFLPVVNKNIENSESLKDQQKVKDSAKESMLKGSKTPSSKIDEELWERIKAMIKEADEQQQNKIQALGVQANVVQEGGKKLSIQLIDYRTYNLKPVSERQGPHSGKLITVEINPDFNLLAADAKVQNYFQKKAKYEAALKEYEAKKATCKDNSYCWLIEPFNPVKYEKIDWDDFKCRMQLPSFSTNPESHRDPQGDINWFRLWPESLQKFFG